VAYSTSLHPATIGGIRPSMLSTSACLTAVFYAGQFPKDDRHQSAPRRQTVVSARRCGLPPDGLSPSLLCQPTAWHVCTTREICVCADDIRQEVRPRPRDIHRQRYVQEPRVTDRVQLFCISASHTQHPSLRL